MNETYETWELGQDFSDHQVKEILKLTVTPFELDYELSY